MRTFSPSLTSPTLFLTGPYGANIFNPRSWGGSSGLNSEEPINFITLEFTRIVLAIGVFAVGVELPKAYMIKHWKSLFFLLVPVMAWVCFFFSFSSLAFGNLKFTLISGLARMCRTHIRLDSRCQFPFQPGHIRMSHSNRSYPSISSCGR